ncbi:unnamed protein product, partial [Schistosoma margrebowiei]
LLIPHCQRHHPNLWINAPLKDPEVERKSFFTDLRKLQLSLRHNLLACHNEVGAYKNANSEQEQYFIRALSNKLQAFHDLPIGEGTTMESNLKGIKEAIISTHHEVLGHKKHHHKEWIAVDTLDKIQERRNKKAAINTN